LWGQYERKTSKSAADALLEGGEEIEPTPGRGNFNLLAQGVQEKIKKRTGSTTEPPQRE